MTEDASSRGGSIQNKREDYLQNQPTLQDVQPVKVQPFSQ